MEDKYLIYIIDNCQFNGEPDYLFKNSSSMVQVAIDMDQDGPEIPYKVSRLNITALIHNALVIKC